MPRPGSSTSPLPHANNFDAIRLAAALLVLYSHHYTLTGQAMEPSFLGINTLGGLAVSMFFTISGYLVTQSWFADPAPVRFALRRILRIWPALTAVVLLSALVLGPLLTTLSPKAYFAHEDTRAYFSTLTMLPAYYLPGVFTGNPSAAVNGSLWTIPLEVQCYAVLLLAGCLGVLSTYQTLIRAAILYIAWYTLFQRPELHNGQINHLLELGAYFTVGALMQATQAHWQSRRLRWAVLLLLAAIACWHMGLRYFSALLIVPYATIVAGTASTPLLRQCGRFGDFSYGTYLFAFPVQQTVIMLWYPAMGFWGSMFAACLITLLCAVASWHLIEQPALTFKPRKTTSRPAPSHMARKMLAFGWFACKPTAAILLLSLASWAWLARQPAPPLGFFSPDGYTDELARHTRLGMVSVTSPQQLRDSLEVAKQYGARLQVDFSLVLPLQRPAKDINTTYTHDGKTLHKSFSPLPVNKIKNLPGHAEIKALMAPYWPVMQAYQEQIASILLIDEPYMHGVSRTEMERAAQRMRALLHEHHLSHIRLGITFSSAMFDARFAQMISAQADRYTHEVEQYYANIRHMALQLADENASQWIENYKKNRITTYDLAGNYYTGGGIPKGFDVIAYNLYTATLLQDTVHTKTLAWFADLNVSPACARFKGQDTPSIRAQLSFYQDGPVDPAGLEKDRPLLSDIFTCKSESILHLLKTHAPSEAHTFQLWGESSANGFMEFNALGEQESSQPELLIAARVQDEVQRTLDFYDKHKADYGAGVMFFIWDDAKDHSIDLNVMGAKSMPGVTRLVFDRIGK
ncbi:MAG: acyltransferase [Pseudomonadota bacterium]|nr:acyltransferase [Pseudomonadota bacterium]